METKFENWGFSLVFIILSENNKIDFKKKERKRDLYNKEQCV